MFLVFDAELLEIFHEERGSAYRQGFGIQRQLLNLEILPLPRLKLVVGDAGAVRQGSNAPV